MIRVIITTPFTGKRTETGFISQEWYDHRYEIFRDYTIKSLMAQTDKDFLYWVCFRPEELHNPTTNKIKKLLDESGLDYKMTFHGINFTDDQVPERNKDLEERLTEMYKEIPHYKEDIYEVMLDSDDMLHTSYVEMVKKKEFRENGALIMNDGFIYSNRDDRLARWLTPVANQNYLIMFPNKIYYDPKKRLEYLKGLESHEQVPVLFKAEYLQPGMFCSIVHGQNMSTVWGHQFMQQEIYYETIKQNVMESFGIKL